MLTTGIKVLKSNLESSLPVVMPKLDLNAGIKNILSNFEIDKDLFKK